MIDAGEEQRLAAVARPRILVLMENRHNAQLLCAALRESYDVATVISDEPSGYDVIDLAIVDGVSVHRYGPHLARARAHQRPLYLPVVLLVDREEPPVLPPVLRSVIDDVLTRPVRKLELQARIETLLRMRSLSQEVIRMRNLYETERVVAERFQTAAMPRRLPEVKGIRLSAYYQAGRRDVQIGGDWYDALALDDGRLVVSVGDVFGSGLDAAVLMAHVRQVIRGVAHIHPDPVMMLDAVNRNLHAEYPDRIVSALAAVLDPVTSVLQYANAGHPPPLVRGADGSVVALASGDVPLGIGSDSPAGHAVSMPPGSALLLYTDGLTEHRRDPIEGQRRLEAIFGSSHVRGAADAAKRIFTSIIEDEAPDDVAILVVEREERSPHGVSWRFRSDDPGAFAQVRDAVCTSLREMGFDPDKCMTAETIFAELVGNVVRYAPGTLEVILDAGDGKAILHVLDRGPSFSYTPRLPSNLLAESGRGLFLVKELSDDFNVSPRPEGGSHARVVLR